MNVLITGGTGYLGRALAKELLKSAERICIYSRGEYAQFQMRRGLNEDSRLRWFIGDVRDRERLEHAMEGVDWVVHAAALKRIEVGAYNPCEMVKTNVWGTQNVIEACKRSGVQKALLISSDKAFEPVSPYGQTKALGESLFLSANTVYPGGPKFSAVRYGNVWKSTGSVLPTWLEMISRGEKILPVTDPECTRFFMRIGEAVKLVLGTLKDMVGGEVNVPELPAYRVGDLVKALGCDSRILGLPEHEKKHESMTFGNTSDRARRMSVEELRTEINGPT